MKKFYITTPIYYVNDKPHLGHAYTTLAADVLARYHRRKGEDVLFLTGTDEHGTKVAEAAKIAGRKPKEFCDEISELYKKSWHLLNISNNDFIRTTEERHIKEVEKILKELKKKGLIYPGEYEGLYCNGCEKFITEKELVDGKCPLHKDTPKKIKEKNYFFKLSKYLKEIERLIDTEKIATGKILIEPKQRGKETKGLLKQGLEDFSVSREKVEWGIPLPWNRKQTIYVWIEALLNYWTAVQGEGRTEYWPPDIQFIGKDILKFHTVYWPAILLALRKELPKRIFIHGYFSIDGQKMSKSLGNVISPEELVGKFGVDAARYLLLSQFPFGRDGDISFKKMKEQYQADLVGGIGNLVLRVLTLVEKKNNGVIPDDRSGFEFNPKESIIRHYENQSPSMQKLKFWNNLVGIQRHIVSPLDKFIEQEKPWALENEKLAPILYNLCEGLRFLAVIIEPFMPGTSKKIFEQLGIEKREKEIKWGGLKAGLKIKKGEPLFPKLEIKK